MMRQEYLNNFNYSAQPQKIVKKGCGCGGGGVKNPVPYPPPMKPQQGR